MSIHPGGDQPEMAQSDEMTVTLQVNGVAHRLVVDPRVSLLAARRERLNLTGTKKGCNHGECGACTVLAGGRRVLAEAPVVVRWFPSTARCPELCDNGRPMIWFDFPRLWAASPDRGRKMIAP